MKRLARGRGGEVENGGGGEPREPVGGGHRLRAFRDQCCLLRPDSNDHICRFSKPQSRRTGALRKVCFLYESFMNLTAIY